MDKVPDTERFYTMSPATSLFYDRWPRFIARHPWRVLFGALLFLALLIGASATAGGKFVDSFTVPGTEAQQALDLLQARFPQQAGDTATVVVKIPAGLRTAAAQGRIATLIAQLHRLPEVVAVSSPYAVAGAISRDGTIARIIVQYDKQADSVAKASASALKTWQEHASASPSFQVEVGGQVIQVAEQSSPGRAELYGVLAAMVILLLLFGSVVAMGLPIITAISGLIGGFLTINVLAAFVDMPSFTTAFAAMIGLGVGIDYALLIVTRFRQSLQAGLSISDALAATAATAGRTVVFAGATVVVAMLGIWTAGIPFTSYLGTAAAIIVIFAVVVATTVLPAILALLGTRVDAWRLPGVAATPRLDRGFGPWVARRTRRAPAPIAIAGIVLVAVIALPFLQIRLGTADQGSNPSSTTTRRAYDLLAEGFGSGFNGTILLAVAIDNPSALPAVRALSGQMRAVAGVAAVSSIVFNGDSSAAILTITAKTAPQDTATAMLITRVRQAGPLALRGAAAHAYVGGATATLVDVDNKVASRLPIFLLAVIGLGFLILMAVFRSIVIPITASLMNLLSVGAALGILVAVFQWGWLGNLIGAGKPGPVEAFLPMFLFAILFGLSMDYEVFLVTRIQEEHLHGHANSDAIDRGVSLSMRLITAAAAIMCSVFLSFAFGDDHAGKEFGIGLSSAIFIDATVIRLFLIPALMHLFGEANWWFPRWLDRIVPHIGIEGPGELEEEVTLQAAA
jgi:RND superfamily putative drug exporter